MNLPAWLTQGIDTYGYWVVLLAVAIESMGIPFPGETALVAGAVYASTQHSLNIALVIVAAATGAILGDNLGYSIGRYGGYPLLQRVLRLLRVSEDRLLYSQRFFEEHGDKTVFLGRFLAVLRAWAAFLAGANQMPRRAFFIWNAAGGIVWATLYGLLGFALGDNLPLLGRILKDLGVFGFVMVGLVVVAVIGLWLFRRRRHNTLRRLVAEPSKMNEPQTKRSAAAPQNKTRKPSAAPHQNALKTPHTPPRRSLRARRRRALRPR